MGYSGVTLTSSHISGARMPMGFSEAWGFLATNHYPNTPHCYRMSSDRYCVGFNISNLWPQKWPGAGRALAGSLQGTCIMRLEALVVSYFAVDASPR